MTKSEDNTITNNMKHFINICHFHSSILTV